jgi:hypothetical protein
MPNLSVQRKGEIALAILEAQIEQEGGLKIGSNLKRHLGDLAKKTGISIDELRAFSLEMLSKFIGKAYEVSSVSVTLSDSRVHRSED